MLGLMRNNKIMNKNKGQIFSNYNLKFIIGLILLIIVICVAIMAPIISPYDLQDQNIKMRLTPPAWNKEGTLKYILGTDGLGRDLLSRMLFGLRISVFMGFTAVIVGAVFGLFIGGIAGYLGGMVNNFLMRIVDIQFSIPFLVLAVAILGLGSPTIPNIIIVLSLTIWPVYARISSGLMASEIRKDYVKSGKLTGLNSIGILTKYIFPSILPSIAVVGTLDVSGMIVLETILSFLGIGVQRPMESLGNIMADGKDYLMTSWWIVTLPGLLIFFILLAINLFANGIREIVSGTSNISGIRQ